MNLRNILKSSNTKSFMGVGFSAFITMLIVAVLSRVVEKSEMGVFLFFLSTSLFLDSLKQGLYNASFIFYVSGVSGKKEKQEITGSAWFISLGISLTIALVFYSLFFLFHDSFLRSGYYLVIKWFPLFTFFADPSIFSIARAESEGNFSRVIKVKLLCSVITAVTVLTGIFFWGRSAEHVIILYILSYAINVVLLLSLSWTGVENIIHCKMKRVLELLSYGKFTLGTSLASGLLHNSDIFIIFTYLGGSDLAVFSLPVKVVTLMHTVLSSFTAVAFPLISKAKKSGNYEEIKRLFYTYAGTLTLAFIPCIILMLFMSKQIIWILGGAEYAGDIRSIYILQLFLIYGFFLSIDRFTGSILDGMDKPQYNSLKVYIMLGLNIIGDLVAVLIFNSLTGVAFVTILNGFLGIWLGFNFIKKDIDIRFQKIITTGFNIITRWFRGKVREDVKTA